MAFTIANWGCQQPSLNAGQETIVPFGGSSTVENTCNVFTYVSPNDAVATIIAANYFDSMAPNLSIGDIIWGSGTDASFAVQVTAVSPHVTVASMGLTTSIGTANIVNNAVTYAKIQEASAGYVLLANPTSSAHNYEEVTLGNGLAFSGTTLEVLPGLIQTATVNLTLTQFNAMYATPYLLVAAPGSGLMLIVDSVELNYLSGGTASANGGNVFVQYTNSTDAGGSVASGIIASATGVVDATSNTLFMAQGVVASTVGVVTAGNALDAGLYLTSSAAFTSGTGATAVVTINYHTIAAS